MSEKLLGALLVGRWPSGAPIKVGQTTDPGAEEQDNSFDFHDDDDAEKLSCPFGAHIRKVNPRNSVNKDVSPVPRILRRGIPFGEPFDVSSPESPRGLMFLAYQTSLQQQFEFLTLHWMNSSTNPARGNDLLVGRSNMTRSLEVHGPEGSVTITAPDQYWIEPTGGAYLFTPGRAGLRKMAEPVHTVGLWKVT